MAALDPYDDPLNPSTANLPPPVAPEGYSFDPWSPTPTPAAATPTTAATPAGNVGDQTTPGTGTGGRTAPGTTAASTAAPAPTPAPTAPSNADTTSAHAGVPYFTDLVGQIGRAKGTSQEGILRDQLSRQIADSLTGAGHSIKWNGDVLMVDGRAYTVGTASATAPASTGGAAPAGANTDGYPAPGYVPAAGSYGNAPPGFDQTKWADPNHQTPKYAVGRILAAAGAPSIANLNAAMANIQAAYPGATFNGKDKITMPDGGVIDVLVNSGSGQNMQWAWQTDDGPAPDAGVPGMGGAGAGAGTSGGASVQYGSNTQLDAAMAAGWAPAKSTYVPGDIPIDTPEFSYEQLMAEGMSQDANSLATDKAIADLLAHPESLDPHTVEILKAKQKDNLAAMQQSDDLEMSTTGHSMGISDSNWMASERGTRRFERDKAIAQGSQDLDIDAAKTNFQDRKSVAELAGGYQQGKDAHKDRVMALATDAPLRAAAIRGDRLALRESVNQKAAELNISADKVMADWLTGIRDDLTKRYGIDVMASIDWAKLGQQDKEFAEDIAIRWASLSQADDQFNATYGLTFAQFQAERDDAAYKRANPK